MSSKTLLFFVLFIGALITIDSCKPKGTDEVNPADSLSVDSTLSSPCLLVSETINSVSYRKYEYDSLNRLLRMLEFNGSPTNNRLMKRYTFKYADSTAKLVSFNETNIAEIDQNFIYEVDYDESGNDVQTLRRFKVYNSGPRTVDSLTVVYNDKKQITELQSASNVSYKWEYDSLGNAKKWSIALPKAMADSTLAEYTNYDKRTNLYAFSKGIQLVQLLNGRAPSRRNLLNYKIGNISYKAEHLYNSQGVPMQTVLKSMATSGKDTSRVETVFVHGLKCK